MRTMLRVRQMEGMTQTSMLKYVEDMTGVSYPTLYEMYVYWETHKEVLVKDTSNRGAGSPKHIYHDTDLNTEQICTIHQFLIEQLNQGISTTAQNIIKHIHEKHNIIIPSRTMSIILQ